MRVRHLAVIATLPALLACGDDDPIVLPIDRIVRFVPDHLDFGQRPALEQTELMVRLESTGGERLQIRDYRFDPATDVFLVHKESGGALRGSYLSPSDPVELMITFDPTVAGPQAADMYVVFEGGETKLPLTGEAFIVEPARAQVEPSSVLFQPAIEIGRRVTQTITVRNVGEKAGSVRVISAQAPFSVTELGGGPVVPDALEPNTARSFELAFTPQSVGSFNKQVKIALDDSLPAEVNATGEGVAAGTLSCPAMLDFGGVERGELLDDTIDCTVSGGAYTVQSISTNTPLFAIISGIPPSGTSITSLRLGVRFVPSGIASAMGRAVSGTLSIVAANNAQTAVTLEGAVLAPQPNGTDLKIAIRWSAAGTDFDLHLVRDGHLPYEDDHDCYWDTLTIDWGVPGDPDDDPFLDKDARNGMGPEEINLGQASGLYDVYVQYYGAPRSEPSVNVTFDYWLEGTQGTSLMHTMPVCGNTWLVGTLDFSGPTPQLIPDGSEVDSWIGRAVNCPPP